MRKAKQVDFPQDRPLTFKEYNKFFEHAQNSVSWTAMNYETSTSAAKEKLYRKGYPKHNTKYFDGDNVLSESNIVEEVVNELVESGILDDDSLAELIAERRKNSGWGITKIKTDLMQKGFSKETIDKTIFYMDDIFAEDNSALVSFLFGELKNQQQGIIEPIVSPELKIDYRVQSKILQKAVRRGFALKDIYAAFEDAAEQFWEYYDK